MFGNLTPVSHALNPSLYRVPLKRDGDKYILYVADNFVRNFTQDTLPDEVKVKLTMISAVSKVNVRDWDITQGDVYLTRTNQNLEEVGWQVSDSYYCLCLTIDLLNELQGAT